MSCTPKFDWKRNSKCDDRGWHPEKKWDDDRKWCNDGGHQWGGYQEKWGSDCHEHKCW